MPQDSVPRPLTTQEFEEAMKSFDDAQDWMQHQLSLKPPCSKPVSTPLDKHLIKASSSAL